MATGWLGWTPEVAWRCTIPDLLIAVRARVKWQQMVNGVEEETSEMKTNKLKAFLSSRAQRG